MSHLPSDPRVQRTRQALREAFLALVLEHGFEAVRVAAIIERAGVNRATFYRHYRSKRDLLKSWTAEVGALLEAGAASLEGLPSDTDDLPAVVTNLFDHIAGHAPYYRLMLGRHGLSSIATDLEQQVVRFLERRPDLLQDLLTPDGAPLGLRVRVYAAQFVGIVRWWLEESNPPSSTQVAAWVWRLEG
jgi:AcrR family transcriptional regulator